MIAQLSVQSDEVLDELVTHLRLRLGSRVRDFRLLASHEGLVIRGQTLTYYAKQLAQHMVMEEAHIQILANDIEVIAESEPDGE